LDGLVIDCGNKNHEEIEEDIWGKINDMLPLRNECLEVLDVMFKYKNDNESIEKQEIFWKNYYRIEIKFLAIFRMRCSQII
jgi:hypothetical protein